MKYIASLILLTLGSCALLKETPTQLGENLLVDVGMDVAENVSDEDLNKDGKIGTQP